MHWGGKFNALGAGRGILLDQPGYKALHHRPSIANSLAWTHINMLKTVHETGVPRRLRKAKLVEEAGTKVLGPVADCCG